MFFFKASVEECQNMKRVLAEFEQASGQAINYTKSVFFFRGNTSLE